ncbi:MAG: hypothetical protein AAFQ98_04155 [Bacteroidota bacterium]
MPSYIIELIICGVAYIAVVYLLVRLFKFNQWQADVPPKKDGDDGGIFVELPPIDLDLPPGVSLPGGGPAQELPKESTEELVH